MRRSRAAGYRALMVLLLLLLVLGTASTDSLTVTTADSLALTLAAAGVRVGNTTSSVSQKSTDSSQITREFFGFDFWAKDVQFWREVFKLMDEDAVGFELVGAGSLGWEKIEPNPPGQGTHAYEWAKMDELVRAAIESGRLLDLELLPRSDWATIVPFRSMESEPCCTMSPPKEDAGSDITNWGMTAYQAWGDFVFNLVERYDGDGVSDAPGIMRPAIKYLQLGNEPEAPGHFIQYGGTPERYARILAVMYEAAKRANPNTKVARGKSNPAHIFDDNPDETTLRARRADYLDFLSISLKLGKDHFDIFEINFNDHYTGFSPSFAGSEQRWPRMATASLL